MSGVQLEFNIGNEKEEDIKLSLMQKQIDEMNESMGKVRRRLFSEVSEAKKLISALQIENQILKKYIMEIKNEKTEWAYGQGGYLFDVSTDKNTRS